MRDVNDAIVSNANAVDFRFSDSLNLGKLKTEIQTVVTNRNSYKEKCINLEIANVSKQF